MKLLFGSDYITCKLIVICIKYTLDQDLLDLLCQTNPSKSVIVNLKLWRDEFLPFTRTIEPVWRSFFWVPKKGDPLFSFLSANCNKRFLALVVTCALPVQWSLPFISVVFFSFTEPIGTCWYLCSPSLVVLAFYLTSFFIHWKHTSKRF
jgi:hypothetical protein